MKNPTSIFAALAALTVFAGLEARGDNLVTIIPTGATAATVANRWAIGSNMSGLGYVDGSNFPGATADNFFTITGEAIPASGGDPIGFTSYLGTGAATPQTLVDNSLTPNTYSGLTYVAANLGLIGPLSFYAIHHRLTGDYLALIQNSSPTVSDQKPMSVPGTSVTPGGTGYFALSYAADNPNAAAGWNANDFYYLRTDSISGHTWFGSMIPALLSGPTDRWDLGAGRGFTDLAYTSTNVGFGFGASQFYYLRLDPITHTTFFGRINPLTGAATDIQNLGGVYRTLTFTTTDVGYGANNFYSIAQPAIVLTPQTIFFPGISAHTACDAAFVVPATASSGLPVTVVVASGPATILGGIVTLTGIGSVTLQATQAGNATFSAAPTVFQIFTVAACAVVLTPQTIVLPVIANHTACDAAFAVPAAASSGLPVTLAVTSGPATIVGGIVTLTGIGNVTVQATQAGDATFSSAPPVSQTFAVTACPVVLTPQTIVFPVIAAHTACDAAFAVPATASSGLPVTLAVTSGPATILGGIVTLTGIGSVTVQATQAGNATFSSAPPVSQTFAVTACPVVLTPQTIVFPVIPAHTACDAAFAVPATASSGLPVTLAVTSGPATIVGGIVTLTGVGSVTLQATQAGNATFSSAAPVSRTFAVMECPVVPVITSPHDVQANGMPINENKLAATVGVPFPPYQIAATGSPTSFAAILLPPGLAVDALTGIISGTPTVPNTWFVTIQAANAAGTGGAILIIVVAPAGVAPIITSAATAEGTVGTPLATYFIAATGLPTSYTATGLPAGLALNPLTGAIAGTPAIAGISDVTITATNATGTSTAVLTLTIAPQLSSRIANFSARAHSGPANQTLILGFVVSGHGKTLLVRGIGPTLAAFGVVDPLPDPQLTLYSGNTLLATNTGWSTSSDAGILPTVAAQAGAFALPSGSNDSALIAVVTGGAYTARISGASHDSGTALAEVYDADFNPATQLMNASARMQLTLTGGNPDPLIIGFVIAGNIPKTVLVRGVGPGLAAFGVTGVLAHPQITLFAGANPIASNSNWMTGNNAAQMTATFDQVGAFGLAAGSLDAALLGTLSPGSYTVQVVGVGNTTGVVLLELYAVP